MAARRVNVFFYGLFMDSNLLRGKGAHPENVRTSSVPGFALRIGNRATLVPSAGERAYGILMELTNAEIEQLYSEAGVRAYLPEAVLAELEDGTRIPALCFNLLEAPAAHERNPEYAAKLRDLAQRLELPAAYVSRI